MKQRLPVVLVIIATYNGEKYVRRQVESVLQQQGVNVRIALYDDCSSDGTIAELASFCKDDRISVTRRMTASGSACMNFLLAVKQNSSENFDFLALCDQDDIWSSDKLLSAVAVLEGRSDLVGYSSAVRAFWKDGKRKTLRQACHVRRWDYLFEGAGQGCTFVLPERVIRRICPFINLRLVQEQAFAFHDWYIYLIVRATVGEGWYFDQCARMQYRQHGSNEIGSRGSFAAILRRVLLLKSGWYWRQVQAALVLSRDAARRCDSTHSKSELASLDVFEERMGRNGGKFWTIYSNSRRRYADRLLLTAAMILGWLR